MKNNAVFGIVLILVIFGLMVGCQPTTKTEPEPKIQMLDLEKCELHTSQMMKDSCYQIKAVEAHNLSVCNMIMIADLKASCYSNVAWELADTAICNQMPSSIYFPKEECYGNIAIKMRNASMCGSALSKIDLQERCYREIGLATNNLLLCEKIITSNSRLWCEALVGKNAKLCDSITDGNTRSACFSGVAQVKNDLLICDENIESSLEQDGCYISVAAYNNELSYCDRLQNQSWSGFKGMCYSAIASKNKNTSICDQIQDYGAKALCYSGIVG